MLGVRLPEGLESQLNHISEISKRSKSSIVKDALAQYLEDMEDYYLAIERLEQHKREGGKTHSLAEVIKRLDVK